MFVGSPLGRRAAALLPLLLLAKQRPRRRLSGNGLSAGRRSAAASLARSRPAELGGLTDERPAPAPTRPCPPGKGTLHTAAPRASRCAAAGRCRHATAASAVRAAQWIPPLPALYTTKGVDSGSESRAATGTCRGANTGGVGGGLPSSHCVCVGDGAATHARQSTYVDRPATEGVRAKVHVCRT